MDCVENLTGEQGGQENERIPRAVKAAADRAKAEARRISEERRAHRRVPGAALGWMNVARVEDGPEVDIVDVSRGGALLESGRPLRPGTHQALEIAGPEKSIIVPFGVLRSRISALEPRGAIYRVACAFSWLLELPELAADASVSLNRPRVESVDPPATVTAEPLMDTVLREAAAPAPLAIPGWQEVVAQFVDGTIVKGFTNDFHVSRQNFSLRTSDNAGDDVSVPLTRLKAVFFARDFDAKPEHLEGKTFVGQTLRRRVHLTFTDGEMIIGTTQGYRAGVAGFFVTPADPRASDVRIFVVATAVRQIRFP